MSQSEIINDNHLLEYLKAQTQEVHPAILDALAYIEAKGLPAMSISVLQVQLLQLLMQWRKPSTILEIGTYLGVSTMALALGHDASIITIDKDQQFQSVRERFLKKAGVDTRIESIRDDGVAFLKTTTQSFDVIFIDANKKAYLDYYHLSMEKLSVGGLLLMDNTLLKGKPWQSPEESLAASMHQLNQAIKSDRRVVSSILPLGDGLTLALKQSD